MHMCVFLSMRWFLEQKYNLPSIFKYTSTFCEVYFGVFLSLKRCLPMVYICAVAQLVRRYCTIGRCCDAIPRKSVASLINHRLYSPSIQILNIALQFTNATTLEQMKQPLSFQHQQCVHGDRRHFPPSSLLTGLLLLALFPILSQQDQRSLKKRDLLERNTRSLFSFSCNICRQLQNQNHISQDIYLCTEPSNEDTFNPITRSEPNVLYLFSENDQNVQS